MFRGEKRLVREERLFGFVARERDGEGLSYRKGHSPIGNAPVVGPEPEPVVHIVSHQSHHLLYVTKPTMSTKTLISNDK